MLSVALFTPLQSVSDAQQPPGEDKPAHGQTNESEANDRAGALLVEADKLRAQQRQVSSEQAVTKYREAAEMFGNRGAFLQAAQSLRSAGEVLQILGDARGALDSYGQARSFSRKAGSSLEEARILNGIAYAHFLQGNANAAKENALAALAIARNLHNRELEAQALSNLGESFYNLGDMAIAEKYQRQALNIWNDLGHQSGRSLALVALGYYYSFQAKPKQAIEYFQDGINAARNANDLRAETIAWNAFANVTAKFGNKQEALASYRRAQDLVELTGDRIFKASILGGTGSVYSSMGDAKTARRYIEQAATIFQEINAPWGIAETKLDLGGIYHSLGDYKHALKTLQEALQLFRTLGMGRLELHSLREIGRVQHSMGDLHGAVRTFQQVLRRITASQDQRYEAYTLTHLASAFESLNDQNRALQYYRQALPLSKAAGDPAGEANALFNIARIERNRGELVQAQQHIEFAIELDESIRARVASHDLRASFLATVREVYELYMDVLVLRHKTDSSAGFDAQAFAVSERAHARSLLDSLQETNTNIREGVDPSCWPKSDLLSEALNEKAALEIQALARKDRSAAENLRREIDALTSDHVAIQDQIRSSSPRYAALTLPQPLALDEVQRLLDDESVFVEYALGDERSYVWLVSRTGLSVHQLASRDEIEAAATRLRNLFIKLQAVTGESVEQRAERERTANEAIPGEIAKLSKLVLEPLAGRLDNKRLLIVADGALQYIPFQSLNDPDLTGSGQNLLAKHEIVYQPSASTLAVILKEGKTRKAAQNSVAVFADPVFEVDDPRVNKVAMASTPESEESKKVKQALRDIGLSADGVEIPRLLASGVEADAIMQSIPWRTGFKAVGFDATRDRVVNHDLAGYSIVHFATHGLINSEHPELSGIVLSLFDEQGRSQDGFLRLHDIYNLRLPTDLVVLSACSTGLGKEIKGEGLVGLTRGFMYAGASSVVASLWKVDDDATAELMRHFYDAMFTKGLTPAAALRDAQLKMSQDKRWNSPYYWAGFIIQGRYDEQVISRELRLLTPTRIAVGMGLLGFLIVTLVLIVRRRRA